MDMDLTSYNGLNNLNCSNVHEGQKPNSNTLHKIPSFTQEKITEVQYQDQESHQNVEIDFTFFTHHSSHQRQRLSSCFSS